MTAHWACSNTDQIIICLVILFILISFTFTLLLCLCIILFHYLLLFYMFVLLICIYYDFANCTQHFCEGLGTASELYDTEVMIRE